MEEVKRRNHPWMKHGLFMNEEKRKRSQPLTVEISDTVSGMTSVDGSEELAPVDGNVPRETSI